MSGRAIVEQWLLEYSCRHHLTKSIAEIAKKCGDVWPLDSCSIPPVFVLLAVMQDIVEQEKAEQYKFVINELALLYDSLPDGIVTFSVYSRLIVALKVLDLFRLLKNNDKLILPQLNSYFPRSGFHHAKAGKSLVKKLNTGQQQFRAVFLTLIVDESARKEYLLTKLHEEYGSEFVARMKELMRRFVDSVNSSLPPCVIDKLIGKDADQRLVDELSSAGSASFELLLDVLHERDSLSADDVINVIRRLRPEAGIQVPTFTDAFTAGMFATPSTMEDDIPSSAPVDVVSGSAPPINSSVSKRLSEVDMFCSLPSAKKGVRPENGGGQPISRHRQSGGDAVWSGNAKSSLSSSKVAMIQPVDNRRHGNVAGGGDDGGVALETETGWIMDAAPAAFDDVEPDSCSSEIEVLGYITGFSAGDVAVLPKLTQVSPMRRHTGPGERTFKVVSGSKGRIQRKVLARSSLQPSASKSKSPVLMCQPGSRSRSAGCGERVPEASVSVETIVCDSEDCNLSDLNQLLVVPSSYSFDQYDVICVADGSDQVRHLIPPIERYLLPEEFRRPCVVKLTRNRELGEQLGIDFYT